MKWLKWFIEQDNGKLLSAIISVIIILLLVLFTQLQKVNFALKMFILAGVVWVSVEIMRWIKLHFIFTQADKKSVS